MSEPTMTTLLDEIFPPDRVYTAEMAGKVAALKHIAADLQAENEKLRRENAMQAGILESYRADVLSRISGVRR